TESAISQTAVIDVVLIFDVSESMLNETTYDDWDELLDPPQGIRYVPAYVDGYDNSTGGGVDPITGLPLDPLNPPHNPPWPEIIYNTQGTLNDRIDRLLPTVDPDFRDKNIAYEPTDAVGSGYLLVTMPDGGTTPNGRVAPREFCRVRAYPNSGAQTRSAVPAWLADEYQDFFA